MGLPKIDISVNKHIYSIVAYKGRLVLVVLVITPVEPSYISLNNTSSSASSFHPSFGIHPPSANPSPAWAFGTQESAKRAAAAVAAAQVAQGIVNGGPKLERTGMEHPTSSGSVPYADAATTAKFHIC